MWSPFGSVTLCYVLGFVPTQKFLRSQILCRLDKSSSDEAINRSISIRLYMQKDHVRILKTCSPCRSLMDYGNRKITQHALESVSLKTARVGHYTYGRRRILWKTKKGVGEGEEEEGYNSPVKQRSHHLCHRPPA